MRLTRENLEISSVFDVKGNPYWGLWVCPKGTAATDRYIIFRVTAPDESEGGPSAFLDGTPILNALSYIRKTKATEVSLSGTEGKENFSLTTPDGTSFSVQGSSEPNHIVRLFRDSPPPHTSFLCAVSHLKRVATLLEQLCGKGAPVGVHIWKEDFKPVQFVGTTPSGQRVEALMVRANLDKDTVWEPPEDWTKVTKGEEGTDAQAKGGD